MDKRWLIQRTNEEYVSYLANASSITPAMAQILINRGAKTPEEVEAFLSEDAIRTDPSIIGGTEDAVSAIKIALEKGKRIFVHGDYDADGLTATAMMVGALRNLGVEVDYFVPNRFNDGYGFNPPAVEKALAAKAELIITVDCGITSFEASRDASKKGIGVIITDHHEPMMDSSTGKPQVPDALAVINPKLSNPEAANLSGAGVALKLIEMLSEEFPGLLKPEEFIDLAVIGTLADSVPLVGENRTIVREGLGAVLEGRRLGIRALNDVSGFNGRTPRPGLIVFTLVPRINAAGRLGDASEVVELMLCGAHDRAQAIASSLNTKNYERQKIEDRVLKEALAMVQKDGYGEAVVLASEGWHEGVVGIVAARVAEKLNRPAFILCISGDKAKGSARSINAFDIHAGLTECSDLLLSFGGHRQAAGLSLKTVDIEPFRRRMSEVVERRVEDFTPAINIDAAVRLSEVNPRLVREISSLEPFGYGNPEPLLGSRGLEVLYPRVVGNNHLKMKLKGEGSVLEAIGYNMGGLIDHVQDSEVDAAYTPGFNDWNGTRSLQLNVKAIRRTTV